MEKKKIPEMYMSSLLWRGIFLHMYTKDTARLYWTVTSNCLRVGEMRFWGLFYSCIWGGACQVACSVLVPWPGIVSVVPAVEAWSLKHWTARKSWDFYFLFHVHRDKIVFFVMNRYCFLKNWVLLKNKEDIVKVVVDV